MSTVEVIGVVSGVITIVVALVGVRDTIIFIQDLSSKYPDFRIRNTTIKVLIDETETEVIKLRKIRVTGLRKLTGLEFKKDIPKVFRDPNNPKDEGRYANVRDLYSLPGRATRTAKNEVEINLKEEDEALHAAHDHTIVVGYVMAEGIDDLWDPPELVASSPIGDERLTMEVHLPPSRRLTRDQNHKPTKLKVFTYSDNGSTRSDLPIEVSAYPFDFGDGRGEVDWFRAVIPKPPGKGKQDVYLEWDWIKTGHKTPPPADQAKTGNTRARQVS